jgi:hypothetical protein
MLVLRVLERMHEVMVMEGGFVFGLHGRPPFRKTVRLLLLRRVQRVGQRGRAGVFGDEGVKPFGESQLLLLGQIASLEEGVALLDCAARTLAHVLDAGECALHQLPKVLQCKRRTHTHAHTREEARHGGNA